MKTIKQRVLPMVLTMGLAACAGPAVIETGPNAEVTYDGLNKVNNTLFDAVWVREDIDLSGYNKVLLADAGVSYRPTRISVEQARLASARDSESDMPMTDEDKDRLVQEVSDVFREELGKSQHFELVTEPGPDVLILQGSLQDVVSYVPPELDRYAGMDRVYLEDFGEATLVLQLFDSESQAILARAIDRDTIGEDFVQEANTVTSWAEVRREAHRWGTILTNGLDAMADGTAFAQPAPGS